MYGNFKLTYWQFTFSLCISFALKLYTCPVGILRRKMRWENTGNNLISSYQNPKVEQVCWASGSGINGLGLGRQDGSVCKDTCHPAWWPEFCLGTHMIESYSLISHTVVYTCTHACTCTYIHTCWHTFTYTYTQNRQTDRSKDRISKMA